MKLTIITINYNNLQGLEKTYHSVVSQTWQDFEWIIIDGGSTDGSKEFLEAHQDKFSYWVSEPDNGIYNAMNKGITHIHGEYVHFLNSGDWLFSNNTYESIFINNTIYGDIIYSNVALVLKPDYYYTKKINSTITLSYFWRDNLNHQNVIVSSSLLSNRPYDEKYKICADYKSYIQYCLDGRSFQYIDSVIAFFDAYGFGSLSNQIRETEQRAIQLELLPSNMLYDYDELATFYDNQRFVNSRKSIRMITSFTNMIIRWLDKFLGNFD